MRSPLGPTLANTFLSHYKKIWLERCPQEIKPSFYRRYVDGIFVLFESQDKLIKFRDYFNGFHPNMSFSYEVERDGKLIFLDVNVFREEGQFLTNVYRKATFNGVDTHFESFLPATYTFGMVYTLAYISFRICSDWTKFNEELRFLKGVFLKNDYPLGFIDSCFKKVIDNVLTESPKSFKNILNCCKVQIVFKSQRRLPSQFRFKEPLPYDLMSKVVYKYMCGRCNSSYYSEMGRHLRVRDGEHVGLSLLTFKKCKPSKENAVRDRLLFCDNDPSFEEFSVLAKASSKFSLEMKESLLIKKDTPKLNRNTTSVELFLFDSR